MSMKTPASRREWIRNARRADKEFPADPGAGFPRERFVTAGYDSTLLLRQGIPIWKTAAAGGGGCERRRIRSIWTQIGVAGIT